MGCWPIARTPNLEVRGTILVWSLLVDPSGKEGPTSSNTTAGNQN
jgi:hypothetical protein